MKKILGALAVAGLMAIGGALTALAQGTFGLILTSPVVVSGSLNYNGGPQSSAIPASGGTVTCTAAGTPTITASGVTANSVFLFGLKTKGGTPAQPFVNTVTPGTSFVITCGGSDTSVYNWVILG